ncbi:hypothetical protein CARUB_v10021543mg [Capsella rubella]|uniref:Pectinesterase inhibitor domain-containing protein n=1 Tax=Capsella rubella TaxID=81985 RepID=R0IBP9_9BRAS|nr:hypothetical protein CARUB_v10021543mg [Capsella rubella]
MVASVKNNNFLVSIVVLLLVVSSSYARFNMMITKSEIDSICTKEKTLSSLCFEVLKPTSKIAALDLSGLAKFFINYQSQNITYALKQLKLLVENTTNFHSRSIYLDCVENYGNALYNNKISLEDLEAKNYDAINARIGTTIAWMYQCIDDLSTIKPMPQFFIKRSNVIGDLSSIILVILEFFLQKD